MWWLNMGNNLEIFSDSQKLLNRPIFWASLKSSEYYWPEPEPVALRAMGQVSTLTELG